VDCERGDDLYFIVPDAADWDHRMPAAALAGVFREPLIVAGSGGGVL
jgi:hypothetical protein